jgi:hypothetical protein
MTDAEKVLRDIARAREIGISGRLRDLRSTEIVNRARDYCDRAGIGYAASDLKPLRTDDPDSAPKTKMFGRPRSARNTRNAA